MLESLLVRSPVEGFFSIRELIGALEPDDLEALSGAMLTAALAREQEKLKTLNSFGAA